MNARNKYDPLTAVCSAAYQDAYHGSGAEQPRNSGIRARNGSDVLSTHDLIMRYCTLDDASFQSEDCGRIWS